MLTKFKMNTGNKGVEEEHEDDYTKDGYTLDQEDFVSNSVLWRMKENQDFLHCIFFSVWGRTGNYKK